MKYYSYKDLKLSAFCLGCAQFGQKYGISNRNHYLKVFEIKSIIDKSIESGVNFFDTAADYGKSEEILGKFLTSYKNRNLAIATKIKYIKNKKPDIIKKEIQSSLELSLKRLQCDCLDIVYIYQYQLFFEAPDVFLEALNKYKKRGFIKHIGISLYEPYEIDKAIKYNEIEVFQIPYNILNKDFEENDKINLLNRQEKLIILRSVFLQGLFFINPDDLPEYFRPINQALKIFYKKIKKHFNSQENFFLSYVLDKQYGPVTLGVYSLPQLITNLNVFNSQQKDNTFKKIEREIPNIDKAYIDPRNWALSGLDKNEKT